MSQFSLAKLANYLCRLNFRAPLGSASQINCLYRIGQLLLFPSPIFLQISSGTRGTGLLRVRASDFLNGVNRCTPKAEVVSSNLAGRASDFKELFNRNRMMECV